MEERKLCPFKKTIDRETNGFTGKQTMHERFEVCAGSNPITTFGTKVSFFCKRTGAITVGSASPPASFTSFTTRSGSSITIERYFGRICACEVVSRSFSRILSEKPLMTAKTTIRTATPSATPTTEINVMTETALRFGLKYFHDRKNSVLIFILLCTF